MAERYDTRAALAEWRSHWRVGLAAFLALGLSFGAFNAISSLFVLPLQEAFGWSRGQLALMHNASLAAALTSPFLGRLIDRFGVRRIMLIGMSLSILCYVALAAMTGSLWLFYTLYLFATVIGLTASGITCSRAVSEAFVKSRGLALAVTRSGLAMTAALLPSALFAVISAFGWRAGYLTLAGLVACLALPAVYAWIGRRPLGPETSDEAHERPRLPSWRELLGNPRILLLCFGAGLGYAPSNALMTQLQPLLVDKGVAAGTAASLVGVVGVASLFGAIVTGALVDRFWAPAVALIFACGSAAGCLIFAMNGSLDAWTGGWAILLIGLGLGAEIDVVAYMVARYFGVRSFASIYGLTVLFVAGGGAAGASLLGAVFDANGSYDLGLYLFACAFVTAGLLYLALGRYPTEAEAQADTDATVPDNAARSPQT